MASMEGIKMKGQKNMEEIRTNLSKEDVVHNMLEIALYLAQ